MTTRETLIQTAETLMRTRGFDAFSFADLANAADIRKASVHYHFPTKADLALTLIEDYAARVLDDLKTVQKKNDKAGKRLAEYLRIYRRALAGGKQLCLCVAVGSSRDSFAPPVLSALKMFHRKSEAWLTRVFEDALADQTITSVYDPRAEAKAVLALVEGAQVLARGRKNARIFDEATAVLAARIVRD